MAWAAHANRRKRRHSRTSQKVLLGSNQKVSGREQGFRGALPRTSSHRRIDGP